MIRYCHGWYHLPAALRKELQQGPALSDIKKMAYHLAAGTALAPYTLDHSVPALALDQGFLPENIYEAFFHFDRASHIAHNEGQQGDKMRNLAIERKARLLRFSAFQTWSTIENLTSCPRPLAYMEAYTMGKELVEAREKNKSYPLHPGSYMTAIHGGERWYNAEKNLHIKQTLDQELAGPEGLFEKALRACEEPLFKKERNFNRLLVLSQYANHLAQKGSECSERVAAFDQEVLRLIDAGETARGVRGEWFERVGDGRINHAEAARLYRWGVEWVPE